MDAKSDVAQTLETKTTEDNSNIPYELSQDEIDFIEKYRNLLDEFQSAANKTLDALFETQTEIIRSLM